MSLGLWAVEEKLYEGEDGEEGVPGAAFQQAGAREAEQGQLKWYTEVLWNPEETWI